MLGYNSTSVKTGCALFGVMNACHSRRSLISTSVLLLFRSYRSILLFCVEDSHSPELVCVLSINSTGVSLTLSACEHEG